MRTPAIRAFINEPSPIIVAKASLKTRVHRNNFTDYIGVKRYDERGEVIGETRFVGLFTSEAYTRAADEVPLIRRKIANVQAAARKGSRFSAEQLDLVLKTYPRDELFQISEADLARISSGVLRLLLRPAPASSSAATASTAMFPRCFIPHATATLRNCAHGRTAFWPKPMVDGRPLSIRHSAKARWRACTSSSALIAVTQSPTKTRWTCRCGSCSRRGKTRSRVSPVRPAPIRRWRPMRASPSPTKNPFSLKKASLTSSPSPVCRQERRCARASGDPTDEAHVSRVKIYHRDHPLDLAEIVPVLERMGLRVQAEVGHPIRIAAHEGATDAIVYVHDLAIERPAGQKRLDARFEKAFEAIWARETENDRFNGLVVALGTDWRSAALLRTLCRYRSQSGLDPSEQVQIRALAEHAGISNNLLKLFAIKFDPASAADIPARRQAAAPVIGEIEKQLESVATLDADRALRRLLALVKSLQRTNYYLHDDAGKPYRHIAVKIASREADPLPAPRPYREIFVWSPDVEGVHLRFGPVARGGLRWSDRRDDFRAEVLGLVKAQQVKNAVIVPVGVEGRLLPKSLPAKGTREEIQAAGIAAYKTFVGALLQITDNIVGGKTVHPPGVVAWDGEDPYLVVAADKGTATFSDIANELSADYDFWLGDAFASGGSAGYDHKKMGITARGAWEAVKRHFREMGRDIQSQPFSVIGIGDMSGDVFGNGMLLSKFISLQAAFDHRHIFLDPDPTNLEAAFNERQRMFNLPRSSWADYDASLISKGGGIFERSAKSIPLSPEIKALTGLDRRRRDAGRADARTSVGAKSTCSGSAASGPTSRPPHSRMRTSATRRMMHFASMRQDLRAKVIAEGANLGVTQAGRIEFARKGGRINTDAIDNSAGVDSSDHEVNIKILTAEAIHEKALKVEDRNALLARMTDEVGHLVLRNNYDQTGALSVMQATAAADLDSHESLIESLEKQGKLDRVVEGLPTMDAFRKLRDGHDGLTRPELAVIMAYAKLDLFATLIASKATG